MRQEPAGDAYFSDPIQFDLRRHLSVLRSRVWTILACALLVLTLGAVHTFRKTPVYRATARLLIDRHLPLADALGGKGEGRNEEYFSTQVNLITSKAVLEKALQRGDLSEHFADSRPAELSRATLPSIARELRTIFLPRTTRPNQPWESMREMLRVEPVGDTNLVDVSAVGPSSAFDARVANAVVKAYIDYTAASRRQTTGEALEVLREQISEQEAAVLRAEDHLQEYREGVSLPDLGLGKERSAVAEAMTGPPRTDPQQQRAGQGPDASMEKLLGMKIIRSDPAVKQFYSRLTEVTLQQQVALRSFGQKHPEVGALTEEMQHVQSELEKAVRRLAESIQSEHATLRARERELAASIQEAGAKLLKSERAAHVYDRLQRDTQRQSQVFETLVARMKELDLSRDAGITNVRLVQEAVEPQRPFKPNRPRDLSIAAIMGLLLGVVAGYALENVDDTIRHPEQLEERLKVPWLGYVPSIKSADRHNGFAERARHALEHPLSPESDALRSIRTNIYFSGERGKIKTVLVTSPSTQQGKSVFAANLAVTVARDGKRVLLADADLRRPAVHRAFGLERERGLSDVLVTGSRVEQMTHKPSDGQSGELESLDVLTAGSQTPHPAELLGGDAMADFIAGVRESYDMVVFDACPAGLVADTAALASRCDAVVMVVKAGQTRCGAAERTVKQLQSVQGKVIGAVISQWDPNRADYYGSYGYYDYTRYYECDPEDRAAGLAEPGDGAPADGEAGTADAATAAAAGPAVVSLLVCPEQGEARRLKLDDGESLAFGRSPKLCDVQLTGRNVSRLHFRISRSEGSIWVEDEGTLNGTRVNGQRIERCELSSGDVIRVCRHEIVVGDLLPEERRGA